LQNYLILPPLFAKLPHTTPLFIKEGLGEISKNPANFRSPSFVKGRLGWI